MNKKIIVFATSIAFSLSAQSEVKDKMDEMLGYIYTLKPFITSEAEYTSPKNAVIIDETLKKMVALSEKIKHEDKVKTTAQQVPAMALNDQLKESQVIFSTGNKSYSLWLLRANLGNCVACHTQLPAKSTNFGSGKKKFLVNTFQEAEFLFIVRNFDKAIEYYSRAIAEFPKNKISDQSLETAISRKVFYFTRVKRDLKALSASLDKDLKNKKLVPMTAGLIRGYSDAAKTIAKEPNPDFSTPENVTAYAEKTLKKELNGELSFDDLTRNLRNLQLSGFLYEYLDKNPKSTLRPNIYYWLSYCESRWEKGLQDSLPESYLKKCINEFPKSAVAPKCYKEYEHLITMGFTGSSGTHIPPEVSAELKQLRQLVGIPDAPKE